MQALRMMLSPTRGFRTHAMAGFIVVVLLLTLGMALAIGRIERGTTRQLAHVQLEEGEITLVERLRWSAEVFVSVGRAYLISGDATQLANLSLAKRDFDRALAGLEKSELSPIGALRLEEVHRAAAAFRAIQEQLLQGSSLFSCVNA